MLELIGELTELTGVSGQEGQVRMALRRHLEGLVDRVFSDPLGNLLAYRAGIRPGSAGSGPAGAGSRAGTGAGLKVLLAAHMDEVGVIARKVDERGFVRFSTLGSLTPQVLLGQRVRFTSGTIGVVSCERLEDMGQLTLRHLYVDVGAATREEALARISIGETASFCSILVRRDHQLVAKALDDRVGCAIVVECLRRLASREGLAHEICAAFTAQEEVGVRGARVAAQGWQPDFAVVVDVTPAGDTPKGLEYEVTLGGGAAVKLMDNIPGALGGFLAPPGVTRFVQAAADRRGIRWQPEVLERGSTDAAAIHLVGPGVLTAVISVPIRYSHTPHEVVDMRDVEAVAALVVAVLEDLDAASWQRMLE
ncbi:MAG: M20/M25/M40 family metallo-hydrolase [Bacillota bacterium]|nr:M20/M25/M40 family metallo-hydrolase [Bacillota bacterium]